MDSSAASRTDRNDSERERRIRLRNLYSQLASLLPPQPRKMTTLQMLEVATVYVNQMRQRVEELKQMKLQVEEEMGADQASTYTIIPAVIDITDMGSTLEINLVTGLYVKNFKLSDIVNILVEEGAEVVTATANNNAGDRIIYSVHCRPLSSRIGIVTSRIQERLKDLDAFTS